MAESAVRCEPVFWNWARDQSIARLVVVSRPMTKQHLSSQHMKLYSDDHSGNGDKGRHQAHRPKTSATHIGTVDKRREPIYNFRCKTDQCGENEAQMKMTRRSALKLSMASLSASFLSFSGCRSDNTVRHILPSVTPTQFSKDTGSLGYPKIRLVYCDPSHMFMKP